MVGATPKSRTFDRKGLAILPGASRHVRPRAAWRWIAILSVFVPLSFILVQCGQAPSAGTLAPNVQGSLGGSSGDNFDDRFPKPQFRDRFPTASESLEQRQPNDDASPVKRTAQTAPAPYRVASLAPTVPYQRRPREDQTTLVSLKSS